MTKSPEHGRALPVIIVLICALTALDTRAQSLSGGWTSGDIGQPVAAGSASIAGGTFTVTGGGADIWGRADQFQFVYQQVAGDAEIVARVASLSAGDPWAKAGVMIRQSLAAGSPHASMLGTPGGGWSAQSRKAADGLTTDSSGPSGTPPGWVRLVRAGNVVSAYHSYDGSTWSVVSSETIALASSVYVGLVVTGHNSEGATGRASFENVTVRGTIVGAPASPSPTPTPSPTPPTGSTQSGWTNGDIGQPVAAGSASIAGGTFTVTGGGADIWGRADQFQFVYQQVAGDAEIVARVASLSAGDPWAKAGVMIRQSLAAGSPHASMLGTPGGGWSAQSRKAADGLTTDSSGPSGTPPGWVRLVRAGNVVSAYHSYDGSTWSVVSSETIALTSSVYVGLVVTGHNSEGATGRASFENVTVRASATPTANQPPTVSFSSPAQGTTFTAPATITLNAVAGDPDGSVIRVDFYAGTQLIQSDTSSPYSASWGNVPAGTYSLRAVATDNTGSTTSSAVDVVVNNPAAQTQAPTRAVFEPSTNDATSVTSYVLALRPAGQSPSTAPVATRDLGKPPVINGEISVDISTLVNPLPSGSYYAVVSAIGPGGSSPSLPSATFAK
jgi:regulation of enolase protein 1 (concanavalin A-like superfamily)